jgi:hypothetical protein
MPLSLVQSYDQCKELQDKLVQSFLPLPGKQYNPIDKQSAVALNMRSIETFIASILSLEALRTSGAVAAWLRPLRVPLARKSALETMSLELRAAVDELARERASHAATARSLRAAEERERGRGQRGMTNKLGDDDDDDDDEDDENDDDDYEQEEEEKKMRFSAKKTGQKRGKRVMIDEDLIEYLEEDKVRAERDAFEFKREVRRLSQVNAGLERERDEMKERERKRERGFSERDAAHVRKDPSVEEVLRLSKLNEGLERELRKAVEEKKQLEALNERLVKERKKLLVSVEEGEELRRALKVGDEKRRTGLEKERDAAREEGKELKELLRVAEVERDAAMRRLDKAQRERDAAVMERDAAVRNLSQRDTLASISDVGSAWQISGASRGRVGEGDVAHSGGGRDGGGVLPVSLSPSALSLMNGTGGGRGEGGGAGLVLRGCADGRLLVMGFVEGGGVGSKEGLEVGDEVLEVMGIGVGGRSIGELRRLLGGGGAHVKVRRKEGKRTVEMNVKLPDGKKRSGSGGAVGDASVHVSGTSGWHIENSPSPPRFPSSARASTAPPRYDF